VFQYPSKVAFGTLQRVLPGQKIPPKALQVNLS
jgi:hypothetical protein